MNQSPLGWPVALSTISDTASAGAISGMDMGDSCKISMLWNWNTIDACFISKSWRITSHGMFAGSCIGVILLVMALEFLRRLSKEYDRYILQQFKQSITLGGGGGRTAQKSTPKLASTTTATATADSSGENNSPYSPTNPTNAMTIPPAAAATIPFRPSLIQQSIRAFLHMITFAIAYFVMLLAMYYNGYFIICIFIGAYLGAFVFTWESVGVSMGSGMTGTAAMEDVTVCCG